VAVASVVDHDVQPAEVRVSLPDRLEHPALVGDVQRQREHLLAVLVREVRQGVGVPRGGGDPVPALQRGLDERAAQAAGRTGDEPDLGHENPSDVQGACYAGIGGASGSPAS
jgi:hypothetical protein